ncbi:Transcription initiation factor TFIID subunit 2 [Sparassis crispa]|uniref:Transcription initiation factor TFIID subunit 2 n=1 Tax=Sparassis crispa TaxID=139825 RepID=A0A401G5P6_9APHY|nr:Transcription initiation factor TFIID subunit 2 [Sparassis crispa]GBE77479.1 Transcription initiation factor TFIID subunit 2 [Sparassis crispa]
MLLCVSTSHQKVVLEIDFSGSLWGYTEITVVPTSKDLKTLHLHSRQCTIHSVTVASYLADFVHHDPLSNIHISNPQDCHTHPELKRRLYSALAEGDEGELSIVIPKEVSLRQSGHTATGIVSEAATPEPQTPGPITQPALPIPEFVPITVNISYSLRNPMDGIQFVLPTDAYPFRVPHVYTTPSSPDAARCWVPCVDNLWEKCTWEFEFVVPRYLEQRDEVAEDDDELREGDSPTVVVCSGELVEQVAHPYNSSKTIFLFSQSTLTSVQHVAFAAGPFHVHPIPAELSSVEDASGSSQPLMHAFCLPGHESLLATSVSFIRSAMSFYVTEFGSYPFGSHKVVFVDEMPTQRFDGATMSLVTVDLLHGDDAIDQAFETRQCLSHALACQWVGINIQQKTWSDTWLVNGLGLYITGLFIRKLLGNNEYRFRLKKDMERVLEMDIGSMPPICQPQILEPPDPANLPFINLKAPLVLHILDRRLGKSGTSLGLSRVLPKVFLSAISGEMPYNAISTHSFLRMCRKVSGIDPRSFAEQWIYGSGCPTFGFSATFNRKKMAVEITMRQDAPAFKVHENNEVAKTLMKPVPFFEGQMTIRIHEADGTPYEHVLDIRSPFKRYEVPFNTKYKRVRRNTKRYLARQAAAQAAAEGDAEAAAAIDMIDMGFGLEIWEKEQERENWKVADWTEEDEQNMSGQTYEWIRIDADFEWIAAIAFDQKDYMWVSQLQRDRDVVAQYEAILVLSKLANPIISSTLTKTILVSNYYFRIRCEAAQALVTCAVQRLEWIGLFHLFKLFLRYCYEPDEARPDLFNHTYVPRPNDFSDLAEYFVRKSLLKAISRVRFENGKTPPIVRQFLIDQLRYNDNTANAYSDALYICSIISSLSCATISTVPPERGEFISADSQPIQDAQDANLLKQALAEVDRYRSMDRLIPTYHNVVTIAVIEFYIMLSVANLIPHDPRMFFPLTREGNYTQVRMAAFDTLFLTKWYTPKIMRYILAVMANDPSRVIRRHVAQNACLSLALLVTMGDMKTSKETESLLIEEDGTAAEKAKENNKKSDIDVMIKALRKDRELGKNEVIREFLMPIALAPDTDNEVRWCLLKLADLLIRGTDETPPKVTIHLPPTPVAEVPPPLPPVKVQLKPQRTLKSGAPSTKNLIVPFTVPPKLKLLPSSSQLDGSARIPTAESPLSTREKRNEPFPIPKLPRKVVVEKKKEKNVPKAQSGGMSLNDLRASRNALKKLQMHKHSAVFMQPVDPVRDRAPNYFEVIKNPMDLSTMNAKLEQGKYNDRFAFEADFHVMISNAKLYNMQGSFVHNEALILESFFEKQWVRINKTLEVADKAAQPRAATVPSSPPVVRTPAPVPSASTPNTTRPTIKLKVGGGGGAISEGTSTHPATAAPKPRGRKPHEKPPLGPPPTAPDIDDGSADLLEEVIAIEREKNESRRLRLTATEKDKDKEKEREKERHVPKLVIGKRKKVSDEPTEDELAALATPSKKEKITAATPMAGPSTTSSPAKELSPEGAPPLRNGTATHKIKEKAARPVPPAAPEPGIPASRPSVKGKEKEVPTGNSTPSKPKKPSPQTTPLHEKKCRDLFKTLTKLPDARIFLKPVDPVLDGCPTYYDEIKEPMDFGTMSNKLGEGVYTTMEDFAKDIELIFSNCRTFNPPTTYPVNCADAVERVFKKEWAKAMEKKLAWNEKRSLQAIINKLVADPISFVFREPVDPVLLGVPTYFDVIPRKDARDLRTIRQKLEADKYDSVEAFETDMDLMITNAITFNGPTSEVGKISVLARNKYKDLLANLRSTAVKRKGSDRGTPQPPKKAKLG